MVRTATLDGSRGRREPTRRFSMHFQGMSTLSGTLCDHTHLSSRESCSKDESVLRNLCYLLKAASPA